MIWVAIYAARLIYFLTAAAAVLILARNIRSVRTEVTASGNGHGDDRLNAIIAQIDTLRNAVASAEARPDIKQYREVLLRLEAVEGDLRTMGNRFEETTESMKRVQNKLAARAARREKAEAAPPAPVEEEDEETPMLPPPTAYNGYQPQAGQARVRRFGKLG